MKKPYQPPGVTTYNWMTRPGHGKALYAGVASRNGKRNLHGEFPVEVADALKESIEGSLASTIPGLVGFALEQLREQKLDLLIQEVRDV